MISFPCNTEWIYTLHKWIEISTTCNNYLNFFLILWFATNWTFLLNDKTLRIIHKSLRSGVSALWSYFSKKGLAFSLYISLHNQFNEKNSRKSKIAQLIANQKSYLHDRFSSNCVCWFAAWVVIDKAANLLNYWIFKSMILGTHTRRTSVYEYSEV